MTCIFKWKHLCWQTFSLNVLMIELVVGPQRFNGNWGLRPYTGWSIWLLVSSTSKILTLKPKKILTFYRWFLRLNFRRNWMAKQDFAVRIPILCVFQLLVKVFLPQDKIGKLLKIGSPAARFGLAIQFILKFCFRNHLYNVSILMGLRVKILVVDETRSQINHTVP